MTDFDMTKIPNLVLMRLEATAADCQQRGQQLFETALGVQRRLLEALARPAEPLMDATARRVPELVAGPPSMSTTAPGRRPGER
ncbi:MAG: hypothetical protein AB1Z98_17105 [Nannocystaceae bacterium]